MLWMLLCAQNRQLVKVIGGSNPHFVRIPFSPGSERSYLPLGNESFLHDIPILSVFACLS